MTTTTSVSIDGVEISLEGDDAEISFHVDGYDVSISVNESHVGRLLERAEDGNIERINKDGPAIALQEMGLLSSVTTIEIEPTHDKWEDLADSQFGGEDEDDGWIF